jgi:SdrD B-like protein/flagellar hook capping protein FlgD
MRNSLGRGFIAAIAITAAITLSTGSVAFASSGSISGTAYQDLNRNGVQDGGEQPFSGHRLYLYTTTGTYITNLVTDTLGHYAFTGLTDGDYRVDYSASSWWEVRDNWVPSTTGSLFATRTVHLAGSAIADFGWRPIVRSTNVSAPIASYTGPNGLRVSSYDDVVDPHEIYDRVMLGLVGQEASTVQILFDYSATSTCQASVSQTNNVYTSYHATIYQNYVSWLDGYDQGVSHEYGHAWSLFHAYMTQQDPTLATYLQARGLAGDSRVDSTYAWSAREMIAEDYRQLFGSDNAKKAAQMNRDIPNAVDVPGLRDFLANIYTQPPPSSGGTTITPLTISSLSVSPAPVKTSGVVAFDVSRSATITIRILDSKGSLVRTLLSSASEAAGTVQATWDRKNSAGRKVRSGTYQASVDASDSDGQTATTSISFTVS